VRAQSLSDILGLNKPIDRLGVESRATIKEFLAAVELATKESEAWRGVVARMRADFAALPQEAGLETRQVIDFTLDRAKENFAITAAITAAINDKDYVQALKRFTEMQDRAAAKHPPVVGNFNPKQVPMKWDDRDRYSIDTKDRVVVLTGWNFNPDGAALKAECRDADGKLVTDVTRHLKVSTRYMAQLDISAGSGVAFQPGTTEVVLAQSGRVLARLPVVWGEPPASSDGSAPPRQGRGSRPSGGRVG
jgi:hypothetical protein